MKVTDIKQQVKRVDRYSIYIDNKYAFSLGEGELLKTGLSIGREVDKNQLAELQDTAVLDKAYDQVLNLIMRRPRSEWEVRDYLKRKGYETENSNLVIARLIDRGYINDLNFASRWVENRRLLKSTSKRRLQQELKQKRVSEEIIHRVLEEDDTDEREVLRELVARKRKQPKYQDNLKLMQYLSRQGYNYDDIKSVIGEGVS